MDEYTYIVGIKSDNRVISYPKEFDSIDEALSFGKNKVKNGTEATINVCKVINGVVNEATVIYTTTFTK